MKKMARASHEHRNLELARLSELAVEHLLGTFSPEEADEYRTLLAKHPDFDLLSLETAAAALQLAAMTPPDPLPERLRIQLATDAAEFSVRAGGTDRSTRHTGTASRIDYTSGRYQRWGWYALQRASYWHSSSGSTDRPESMSRA